VLENLQSFTESLPPLLQWVGVMLAGAIPFIESYGGSVLGIISGVPPVVAVLAAIVGNIVSMLVFVLVASRVRTAATSGRTKPDSPRRVKLRQRFDKYGVAGVSLLGQTLLPSQITSAIMISFGASRRAVIGWQIVSIILWGVAFGLLAVLVFGENAAALL
jgi:steroid 5-alpha reductase family enzyme